jgi:hypothetical protein
VSVVEEGGGEYVSSPGGSLMGGDRLPGVCHEPRGRLWEETVCLVYAMSSVDREYSSAHLMRGDYRGRDPSQLCHVPCCAAIDYLTGLLRRMFWRYALV